MRHHVRQNLVSLDAARNLALDGLLFLAGEPARMGKFLEGTGIPPGALRERAREDSTLIAVLEYLLADESLLLVFAAHGGLDPSAVTPALMRLQAEGAT